METSERVTVDRKTLETIVDRYVNHVGCGGCAMKDGQCVELGCRVRLNNLLDIQPAEPGLTADQIECAKLEAELEQAVVDGVIGWYTIDSSWGTHADWCVQAGNAGLALCGPTKLDALRKAIAYVADLRNPPLPDVAEMSVEDCYAELDGTTGLVKRDGMWQQAWWTATGGLLATRNGDNDSDFYRRAVVALRKCK